ncbi:GerA spore germination protein [Cohnella sp. SGD-V74]|uniref:spore germination protein n=1 Tax=unclassified Cohnella TaxID=2636738 RepID=UPI000B8C5E0F|nr:MULTISPECIES: spore germination protein [unclassified Cohnella]PRX73504.1 GerA spore germination protein [Cohnella sp. SGD-V74]
MNRKHPPHDSHHPSHAHASKDRRRSATLSPEQLNRETLSELFEASGDVNMHSYYEEGEAPSGLNPLLIYCEGMIDSSQLNDFLYVQLRRLLSGSSDKGGIAGNALPFHSQNVYRIEGDNAVESMCMQVFSGNLVLFFEESKSMHVVQMASPPQRNPEESNTEISIKGPRDGFTEAIETNVALVRKRLKTPSLGVEYFHIGTRSVTSVALLYMADIANKDLLEEARRRIRKIDIDGVLSSQLLEEALADRTYSLFPLIEYMGRPDYISAGLLRGRFAIIVDGSPMVLMAPSNIMTMLKSPEDMHLPYYYVALERVLRVIGLVVAIFFPGFWVAISAFNLDQIPFPLLATIVVSRLGLPLSGPVDLFLMIGLFELFREAGMRLPKAVGQTVAVVGGLIVGEAAINAGLTGPTTLVVSAMTAVATFTLVNQSLSGSVTFIRLFVLTLSCLFGMLGFFLAAFLIVVYMSSLTSFGIPFFSPLSPIRWKEAMFALFAFPKSRYKKRPSLLGPRDSTRQGEDS